MNGKIISCCSAMVAVCAVLMAASAASSVVRGELREWHEMNEAYAACHRLAIERATVDEAISRLPHPQRLPDNVVDEMTRNHDLACKWWTLWGLRNDGHTRQGSVWVRGGPWAYIFGYSAEPPK